MSPEAIPFYEDGDELTGLATAAVTGKRFVRISGDKPASGEAVSVAPAAAGAVAIGVATYDAAIGKRVTIKTINSGVVIPVTAAAVIAAGARVASDATGQAVTAGAGAPALGIALTGAAAGADAQISLAYCTG